MVGLVIDLQGSLREWRRKQGVGVSGADREDVFRYPVKGSTPTALRISREDPRLSRSIMRN